VDKRSIITYRVYSLDVWGHGSEDCCAAYDCPCIVPCEGPNVDGAPVCEECQACESTIGQGCPNENTVHDTDAHECDASYEVNDRCRVGEIEVLTDEGATHNVDLRGKLSSNGTPLCFTSWHVSDEELTRALIDCGFLKDRVTASELEFDGEEDGMIFVDDASDGIPIFQLEFDGAVDAPMPDDEHGPKLDGTGLDPAPGQD
jgi:hypothetical protein